MFEEDGELCFEVSTEEFDPMFDEIGSQLKIKQLQRGKTGSSAGIAVIL